MKSVCFLCGKPAVLICKCTPKGEAFCSDCFGDHANSSSAVHEPEPIVEAALPVPIPPALKKRETQIRRFVDSLTSLRTTVDSILEEGTRLAWNIETFAKENQDITAKHDAFELDIGSRLLPLEQKLTTAYRHAIISLDSTQPQLPPATPVDSQLSTLQARLQHITDENDQLQYQLNLMKRDQGQQGEEAEKLRERLAKLEEENDALKKGNHKILKRATQLEDENKKMAWQKSDAQAALLALKQRSDFLEEERKVQPRGTSTTSIPSSFPSSVCENCHNRNRPDTTGWRGIALSETPEMAALIPDLCSRECFDAMKKIIKGPGLFGFFAK